MASHSCKQVWITVTFLIAFTCGINKAERDRPLLNFDHHYETNYEASSNLSPVVASTNPKYNNLRENHYYLQQSHSRPRNYHFSATGPDGPINRHHNPAPLASNNVQISSGEYAIQDSLPAAGHHSHSHGHSHGHSKCNSALGILGVLGLAAYLQSVLQNMSTTMGRRRKRSERRDSNDSDTVIEKLLPLLSAVAFARDGLVPIECTYYPVCYGSSLLVKRLGSHGRGIAQQLSQGIGRILNPIMKNNLEMHQIKKASKFGRSGGQCKKIYKQCSVLDRLPVLSIPSSFLSSAGL